MIKILFQHIWCHKTVYNRIHCMFNYTIKWMVLDAQTNEIPLIIWLYCVCRKHYIQQAYLTKQKIIDKVIDFIILNISLTPFAKILVAAHKMINKNNTGECISLSECVCSMIHNIVFCGPIIPYCYGCILTCILLSPVLVIANYLIQNNDRYDIIDMTNYISMGDRYNNKIADKTIWNEPWMFRT